MKILVTGGTGFIGRKLLLRLFKDGHELVLLTRDRKKTIQDIGLPCQVFECDLLKETPPPAALSEIEGVIHLAGESLVTGRWTAFQKEKICNSRVMGTRNLIKGLKAMAENLSGVFISASAIGIYGNRGDEKLAEGSDPGEGFLAEVCRNWEIETNKASSLGMRVINLRFGVILGHEGGILSQISSPFAMGLGATLGSGKQWMSWVHIDDVVETICYVIKNQHISGPVNVVAPHAVRNDDFTRILAERLHSKALLRVPAACIHLGIGDMSEMVLNSDRVFPSRLESEGYRFTYPTLRLALDEIYGEFPNKTFETSQFLPKPVQEIFSFFSEAKNLEAITPSWLNFKILSQDSQTIKSGSEIKYSLKLHGIPIQWVSQIKNYKINESFTDEQIKGPYKSWSHEHQFESLRGGTLVLDHVSYRLPLGLAGKMFASKFVERDIKTIFNFRKKQLAEIFS